VLNVGVVLLVLYYVFTWYGDRLAKQLAGHID
jgi:hypothetical protein